MFVYEEAWDYEGYLNSDLLEYKLKQERIFEKLQLKAENIKKIQNIKNTVNVVIFAEIYCPDCRAVVPFLEKFSRINENITINIFPREGNREYISFHSQNSYIPLVLVEDTKKGEDEFVRILEESLPQVIEKYKSVENIEERRKIIYEFRTGQMNDELENYLVNKILEIIN